MTILIGAIVGILLAFGGAGLYNYFTYFPGKNPALFLFDENGKVNYYKGYSTRVKYVPFKSRAFLGKIGMASYANQKKQTPDTDDITEFPFSTEHKGICGADHLQSMFVMIAFQGTSEKPTQKILSYDLRCTVDGVDMKRLFFKIRDELSGSYADDARVKKIKADALKEYREIYSKKKYISKKSWNQWVANDKIYYEKDSATIKAAKDAQELIVCQEKAESEKLIDMSNEDFNDYLAKNNIFSEFL